MFTPRNILTLTVCVLLSSCSSVQTPQPPTNSETTYLSEATPLVAWGKRSGEGYFSADGSQMIFQSEGEADNPFYQIYLRDLKTGKTQRVSPGIGKTTCAWIHPNNNKALYASTHEDPHYLQKVQKELERRKNKSHKRYAWDFDPTYDIYAYDFKTNLNTNLTQTMGYDAEGSYSPDGKLIVFGSNRSAYDKDLTSDEKQQLEKDPGYFMDLYVMNADGSNVQQLTDKPGYDGGPFFSPDGTKIVWRHFSADGRTAEIFLMNRDGSDKKQLTKLGALSWAPYFHPSGEYIIFSSNLEGHRNFELYIVDSNGENTPVRVTYTNGFDGLPVFHPDGSSLAWATTRTPTKESQIYSSRWDDNAARRALGLF